VEIAPFVANYLKLMILSIIKSHSAIVRIAIYLKEVVIFMKIDL